MQANRHPFTESGKSHPGRFLSPVRETPESKVGRRAALDELPLSESRKWRVVAVEDAGSRDEILFHICDSCGCWVERRNAGLSCDCKVSGCHNRPLSATGQPLAAFRLPKQRQGASVTGARAAAVPANVARPEGNERLRQLAAEANRIPVQMNPDTFKAGKVGRPKGKPSPSSAGVKLGHVTMSATVNGVRMVYDKARGGWVDATPGDAS